MGDRSGIGVVELAILEALDARGARPGRRPAGNVRVLADIENRIGLAPGYAYEVLVDLARPWILPVQLVEGIGNYGDRRGDPAGAASHTMSRLTAAGQVVLAAERGERAPVPVGIINGSAHRGGCRPPFRPERIIDAVRQAIRRPRVTGRELVGMVGLPEFPAGCAVSGDLAALAAGQPTMLRLQARVSVAGDQNGVVVQDMPPNAGRDKVIAELGDQAWRRAGYSGPGDAQRLPLANIKDISRDGNDRFLCIPEPGTTPERLRDLLADADGITTTMPAALPRPMPALIREQVRAYPGEDLQASLACLEDAIRGQAPGN